jgi:hypothetical protein
MRMYFLLWLLILGFVVSNCELSDKKVSPDSGNSQIEDAQTIEESEVVEVNEPASWITDSTKDIKYLHITWTKEPATSLTFQWQSSYINIEKYKPVVWIVKAKDVKIEANKISMPYAKQFVFTGNGFLYTTEDINGNKEKRAQYTVEVFNLEEDTEYYYRAGTFDDFDFEKREFVNPNLSDAYKIKTGLKAGNKKPFKVFAGGDSQSGISRIKNNIEYIKNIKVDFWLFYGDLVEVGTQPEWDAYFDAMQPLFVNKVFMPVQGNHETISELFYYQFALPVMPGLPEEFKEHHWSFDYGIAHFVGLNSLTDATVKSANTFLEDDLKRARENQNIKWIVVMFHHPAYSACSTHGSTQRVIDNWVPIFEKYRVDLVLSGHDHNYERTYPIKNNQKVSQGEGVQYVVCSPFMSPKWYSAGSDWWTYKSRDGSDGAYGIIEIDNSSLTFTAYTNDGVDVIDTFTLKKD